MKSKYIQTRAGKMHYYHKARAGRPKLLCLHGYLDTGKSFVFIDNYLQDHFEVFYFEWPGHGNSELTDSSFHGAALLALLVEIAAELFTEPFYLLGHSLGAAFGARLAGVIPEKIKGLILFEGFSGLAPIEEELKRVLQWSKQFPLIDKDIARQINKRRDAGFTYAQALQVIQAKNPRLSLQAANTLATQLTKKNQGDGLSWHFDERVRTNFIPIPFPPGLSRALWQRIECPVLIIFGEKTALNPGRHDEKSKNEKLEVQMKEILSHFKNVRLKVIANAGHNFHHDQPEEVLKLLQPFLENQCEIYHD